MLKKLLFNIHWLIGITIGIALALMGVTGAMMVFEDEIISVLNGRPAHVTPAGKPLSVTELLNTIRTDNPGRQVAGLTLASDPEQAAEVKWVRSATGRNGPGELASSLVNPYTGKLIEVTTRRGEDFMRDVQHLHRRLMLNPSMGPPVRVVVDAPGTRPRIVGERYVSWQEKLTSYCVLALLVMVATGLYLRWPRGRAMRNWRSWLSINFKLKGAAFLWSLHAVVGTVVLLGYLMSAHSGLAMSEILWYNDGFAKLAGTTYDHGVIRGAYVRAQNSTVNTNEYDLERLWGAFNQEAPRYRTATIELAQSTADKLQISYLQNRVVGGEVSGRDISTVVLDAASGAVVSHEKFGDKPVLQRVALQNFDIHSGNIFGLPGRIFIMFTSLMMPVLMVTGWMLYLNRRKRKARSKAAREMTESIRQPV